MMKSILTSALLVSAALGTAVPRPGKKVDYTGFKVLRVAATEDVKAQIEGLAAHVLNPGKSSQLDVVVSPENVDALTALVAESRVLNEDVDAALAEEGETTAYAGRFAELDFFQRARLMECSPERDLVHCISPVCRPYPVPHRPASWLHWPV